MAESKLGDKVSVEAFQLFRLLGFNSLAESLGITGSERDDIEYMSGTAMGRALVRNGRLPSGSLTDLMDSLSRLYEGLGLGLVYYHEHGDGSLAIGFEECAGCRGTEPVHRPICYVEAGLICGIVSEALGEEYSSREVKCIGGLGDHACEFVLTKK